MKELNFDEEIVIDFNTLPFDDTEGAEQRDLELVDALYSDDWEDDDIELNALPDLEGL